MSERLQIVQWNVRINCDSRRISEMLASTIRKPSLVHLQEVSDNAFDELISTLRPDGHAFSLHRRRPGKREGRNRRMGVASLGFGARLLENALVARSVFPERTLVTRWAVDGIDVRCLNFHSITGTDYKKAKSSNFATLADFVADGDLDFLACDANEPKVDSMNDEEVRFFDNRDRGKCAAMLFGPSPVHSLQDALKVRLQRDGSAPDTAPLAVSHRIRGSARRYDHIYFGSRWSLSGIEYDYDAGCAASSDHAIVVAEFDSVEDEDREREFWSKADSTDHVDWDGAKRMVLPRLKPSR